MNTKDFFWKKYGFAFQLVVFAFLVSCVDSRSFFRRRSLFSEPTKAIPGPEKNYSGIRIKNDSLLLIYYHEQTIAVVETDASRNLYNCELLEVRTKTDKQVALNNLKAVVPVQMKIGFTDMLDLMNQCSKLDISWGSGKSLDGNDKKSFFTEERQFTSIFSGLFPGTKWCGSGDSAASYHDLGSERQLDKCCRNHDLCPVKVAGFRTQYNLTNYALYTRSHCSCDDFFYNCLKALETPISKAVGHIYFNVTPVICVEDVPAEDGMSKGKKQFTTKKMRF